MERIHHPRLMEKIRRNDVPEKTFYKVIDSPVGPITLIANHEALIGLLWGEDNSHASSQSDNHKIINKTKKQLEEYFNGKRFSFDIPLAPQGTEFQKKVWQELLKIPYGKHITYGEQAQFLGRPKAARAVGAANGKNPIGIIIPCHRVIGKSGHLTGFAGGLKIKKHLLTLEGCGKSL